LVSAAMLKREVAVDHFAKVHSLTKALIARLKGDAKEKHRRGVLDDEMAVQFPTGSA